MVEFGEECFLVGGEWGLFVAVEEGGEEDEWVVRRSEGWEREGLVS